MPRPRFSIRDLGFVVVIVALLLGWFTERQRARRAFATAQRAMAEAAEMRAMAELAAAKSQATSGPPAP